jgi:hypothetical protein
VDNIELDLREVGWDCRIELICLMVATNRALVNMIIRDHVPQYSENFLSSSKIGGVSIRTCS